MKQPEFFQTFKLFKPLCLRHPANLYRQLIDSQPSPENIRLALNPEAIKRKETVAGFSYEDFVTALNEGALTEHVEHQVGDEVQGVVRAYAESGVFVEVGLKSWAYMPLKNVSLAAIAEASEMLELGQHITARVKKVGVQSILGGDEEATQLILDMTSDQRSAAWEEIRLSLTGAPGSTQLFDVQVMEVRPFGAVVKTKTGLDGLISSFALADRAGDQGLVGEFLKCTVEGRTTVPDDTTTLQERTTLFFSHRDYITKELAGDLSEGQVIEATVSSVNNLQVWLEYRRSKLPVEKINMSSKLSFEVTDIFSEGENVKAYVASVDENSGRIKLSFKLLERKPGQMVDDKQAVFENAEATAERVFKRASEIKAKTLASIEKTFATAKPKGKALKEKKKKASFDVDDFAEGLSF